MARALEANTTLTQLNLGQSRIGAEGAAQVARALWLMLCWVNATLTQLDLRYSSIGAEGATQVARALEVNTPFYAAGSYAQRYR